MKTPTTQRAGWRKLHAVQGLAEKHSQSNETGMENISSSIVLWSSVCMPYISLCSWSCACVYVLFSCCYEHMEDHQAYGSIFRSTFNFWLIDWNKSCLYDDETLSSHDKTWSLETMNGSPFNQIKTNLVCMMMRLCPIMTKLRAWRLNGSSFNLCMMTVFWSFTFRLVYFPLL